MIEGKVVKAATREHAAKIKANNLATFVSRAMIKKIVHKLLVGLFAFRIFVGEIVAFLIEYLSKYSLKALKRRFRAGNLASRLIRPLFEVKKIRTIFGAQLAAAVFTVGSLGIPFAETSGLAYPEAGKTEVVLDVDQAILTTEEVGFQVPVTELVGVSQRFHAGHPAYDMRAPLGSEVVPVNDGVVKEIIHSAYGYGRRVIVDHGEGLVSLYAHMGKIAVDEGDEVDKEDVLGEVGLTGWTTGPHIHLEMYKDESVVSPGRYLII